MQQVKLEEPGGGDVLAVGKQQTRFVCIMLKSHTHLFYQHATSYATPSTIHGSTINVNIAAALHILYTNNKFNVNYYLLLNRV